MNEVTGAFSLMDAGFLAEFQLTPKILFKLMILSCPSDGQNISGVFCILSLDAHIVAITLLAIFYPSKPILMY